MPPNPAQALKVPKTGPNRLSGRPRVYDARQRVALNMVPADILRVDEYAILKGMDRGKAIHSLIFQALKAPPVVQAVAEAADLSIPEPQSQLAPAEVVETPQIEASGRCWMRKLTL